MSDVAVVVGAGGDIGTAIAQALAPAVGSVLLVDRDREALECVTELLLREGRHVEALVADAAADNFSRTVTSAAGTLGQVRAAVHAVAYEEHRAAAEVGLDSIDLSYRVGPRAAFALFTDLHRAELVAAGSALTVIGSLHATKSFRNTIGYNMAHASLKAMVATLAHEWAASGVRVNAVVPGWTLTRGEERLYGRDHLDRVANLLPMRRFARPQDVAQAVAFISSNSASYVSGEFLYVDGALGVSLAALPGVKQ